MCARMAIRSGSAFGLMDLLESLGKRVKVLCADPVSPRYRFLSGGRADLLGTPEGALVCIDIAAPDMAGAYAAFAKQADLVIDHHATNPILVNGIISMPLPGRPERFWWIWQRNWARFHCGPRRILYGDCY